MAANEHCITFQDVEDAYKRIKGTAHYTPVLTSESLDILAGRSCFFKIEALQRTGSFKFRGALNAVRSKMESLPDSCSSLDVVTHSSGNHAQALALAAKLACTKTCKVTATIAMPKNAPQVKKNAVSAFGGVIVETENNNEARDAVAEKIRVETGGTFVHPSEDPKVIAGQGTVCVEFVQQMAERGKDLDVVIIPVGGGGLAAGNCVTLKASFGEDIQIVLAEPSELDDAKRSLEAGILLKHAPDNKLNSVADGLKTTLGPNTFPILRDSVSDVFTVSEGEILRATKLIWERLKICIEPSAGVGVAVVMSDAFRAKYGPDKNVGIVLCGGNVDVLKISEKMHLAGL